MSKIICPKRKESWRFKTTKRDIFQTMRETYLEIYLSIYSKAKVQNHCHKWRKKAKVHYRPRMCSLLYKNTKINDRYVVDDDTNTYQGMSPTYPAGQPRRNKSKGKFFFLTRTLCCRSPSFIEEYVRGCTVLPRSIWILLFSFRVIRLFSFGLFGLSVGKIF